MIDMKKKAEDILEDYTYSYSQVDLETLAKFLNQIKIEAIKEFSEKVKDVTFHYYDSDIDNIIKEF